ncbi:YdcH family protein [Thaumasiovibrio subtropicus]|uniref:YdcH family protein n=1 Tax=Thaumasiovibrio subtropicus TaxID=1891207 RepID=UPI000B358EEE|nr:YdcH family protein [Thaumasiovibrio subtropicus]
MLGEKHDLVTDFPHFSERIAEMRQQNADFKEMSQQYDDLDKQIRVLELNDSPISDMAFNRLKKHRAHLKDRLYHMLTH